MAGLGLLTAVWGRPKLTEFVLRYYEGLGFHHKVLVSSADDPGFIDPSYSAATWNMTSHSNDPLSDKWNHGTKWILDRLKFMDSADLGGVMIVGSDDLVTANYIEYCKYLLERGADYIFLPALYFYDLSTGDMHYCLAERLGLGRVLSRRLLDRLDWKPWEDGLNKGLDGSMWRKVSALDDVKVVKIGVQACSQLGIAAMDIKGAGENLWTYEQATGSLVGSKIKDPERVLRKHFPKQADALLNWKK